MPLLPRAGDADEVAGDVVLVKQTGPRAGAVVFQSLHGPDGGAQRNGCAVALWLDETPVGNPRRAVTVDDAHRLVPDAFRDEDALEIPLNALAGARTARTPADVRLRSP